MITKMVCIDGYKVPNITLGKTYDIDISDIRHELYYFIDDSGYKGSYLISRFISLAEWREQQINSILDGE